MPPNFYISLLRKKVSQHPKQAILEDGPFTSTSAPKKEFFYRNTPFKKKQKLGVSQINKLVYCCIKEKFYT